MASSFVGDTVGVFVVLLPVNVCVVGNCRDTEGFTGWDVGGFPGAVVPGVMVRTGAVGATCVVTRAPPPAALTGAPMAPVANESPISKDMVKNLVFITD